jgi:Ca2+-binding RTX toxin-like protein
MTKAHSAFSNHVGDHDSLVDNEVSNAPTPANILPTGTILYGDEGLTVVTASHHAGSSHGGATSSSGGSALVTNAAASGLTINVIYDSSVNSAPAGFKTDVAAAVQYLQSQFSDPITITIDVGYGEVAGYGLSSNALGESSTYLNSYSYSQLANALKADSTSASDASAAASLPSTNPTGTGTFWVTTAESKALGLSSSNSSIDGYVGFGSGANLFDYNNSDGVTAGQYDFYGVVLHEMTEVMGRQMMDGQTFAGTRGYEPLDLFHYSATSVHTFSGTTAGYFSADGGNTNLHNFNTNPGGDFGDWAGPTLDAANAYGSPGVIEPFSSADLTLMDVLGFNSSSSSSSSSSPPPPPSQPDLVVSGLALNDMTISYQIGNTGNATAGASTTGLYLSTDSTITTSDMLLGTHASPSVSAGGLDSESLSLSLPGSLNPGTYYIGVVADSGGAVAESNETNNASSAVPVILGNSAANTLFDTMGNDTIFGLGGNDTIYAGTGNDVLIGGVGSDTLRGGTGNNQFVYNATNEGLDQIRDFSLGDVFDFSHLGFGNSLAVNGQNTGVLDQTHFVANSKGPTTAAQEFWFNTSNHTLYFDGDGSGLAAPTAMAHVESNIVIHNTDILMV